MSRGHLAGAYARQAGVRHRRLGCGPTAEDRRPLPLPTVPVGMATDSGTWHPGKYLSRAACCCASTTATGAVSSAGAAAGSVATQTRAMGGKAAHAADTAATKSRKKAMQLLMDGLVRPVAMPFQLMGSGARVASLEALAATPNPNPWPRRLTLALILALALALTLTRRWPRRCPRSPRRPRPK